MVNYHCQTNKVLICMQGAIERPIRLDRFSNGAFTEAEFSLWKLARSKAGQKPLTRVEVATKQQEMQKFMNRNLDHDEINNHIDSRLEQKVLTHGDISGIDVPKQMSRVRAQMEELRNELTNTKITLATRSTLQEKL